MNVVPVGPARNPALQVHGPVDNVPTLLLGQGSGTQVPDHAEFAKVNDDGE